MPQRIPPATTLPLLSAAPRGGDAPVLRAGQVLQATVSAAGNDGTATLELGGVSLRALTRLPLTVGQRLTVSVEHEHGQLVLRVQEGAEQRTRAEALRTALPRQAPPEPLIERLQGLLQGREAGLPTGAREAVTRLLQSLPTVRQLTSAEGLRRAVRDSGLLLEARLAQADPGVSRDFKGQLLRLLAALRRQAAEPAGTRPGPARAPADAPPAPPAGRPAPMLPGTPTSAPARPPAAAAPQPGTPTGAPPGVGRTPPPLTAPAAQAPAGARAPHGAADAPPRPAGTHLPFASLLKQVEATVARLQVQQLSSGAGSEHAEEPTWALEIPLRHGESVETLHLLLRRRRRGGKAGGDLWSAVLRLSPPDHGPIRIVVTLAEGTVSARVQAEREATADLFRDELERLRERLRAQGLTVGELGATHGLPPDAGTAPLPRLLHETA